MIAKPAQTSGSLREALGLILDSRPELKGFHRQPREFLDQQPFDARFAERCRQALARLISIEDEGILTVCSARRDEGRSSVAAALALTLARTRGHGGVLLLDLDFGHAAQADIFSIAPAPGLADYLEGRERLRAVSGGPGRQLWLVTAGTHLNDPVRLFHTLTSESMLTVFRERFQWIVIDLPPLLGNPEVVALTAQADWHVVVGRHRRTTIADLRKASQLIGHDRPAGFLLTSDSTRVPSWIRRLL